MKWTVYLTLSVWSMSIGAGCASITKVFYHEPHEISVSDARKVYHYDDYSDRHKKLTSEQSRSINDLHGEEISREGDLIAYYHAKKRKPLRDKADIFLVHVRGEGSQLDLIVSTRGRIVDQIVVKNNLIREGKPAVPNEFLQQFIGHSLQDSWQMAEKPQDLVALPSMIRPISGRRKISKEITSNIRKVLVWLTVLEIQ
ncbi:MAG: hypothetical protein ACE5HN_00485 [Nitrospiria bacterium]